MRARIFSGGSWAGGVAGSDAGVEGEEVEGGEGDDDDEVKVELRRARDERTNSLRRAIVLRDMMDALGVKVFRTPEADVLSEVD